MTDFAYDGDRHALIRAWDTGAGRVAGTLVHLSAETSPETALQICATLSRLSELLWRSYTHPASLSGSFASNSEGWRRETERNAFPEVTDALRNPHLPQDGYLIQSYIPAVETAHHLGRLLHHLGDAELHEHIAGEVDEEIAAVDRAERGELTGRARQAIGLTRPDASPLQMVAAHEMFIEQPLGSPELFEAVDATAASVVAAHWLYAAATVVARTTDCELTSVVMEADNIEALPVEVATEVLIRIEDSESPQDVVVTLVRDAMMVAEARIPDPDQLINDILHAQELSRKLGPGDPDLLDDLMPRLSPLDPLRPAHDLLEDLLHGIRGCLLLYRDTRYDTEDAEEFHEDDSGRNDELISEFLEELTAEAVTQVSRIL